MIPRLKSLSEKLGVKPGMKICVLNAPKQYRSILGILPDGATYHTSLGRGRWDFIHFFVRDRSELEKLFPDVKERLEPDGTLWVSWPKMSSDMTTDLKESVVMELGLNIGLVDVKVTAIDETWSGLKFVYRLKDR